MQNEPDPKAPRRTVRFDGDEPVVQRGGRLIYTAKLPAGYHSVTDGAQCVAGKLRGREITEPTPGVLTLAELRAHLAQQI